MIGYSDHTEPNKDLLALSIAYELGAQIIEKHFTFNKKLKGNDHYHSADKLDLKNYFKFQEKIKTLKGTTTFRKDVQKKSIKNARRSIYALKNIKSGEILTKKNIITLRPNVGIPASDWDKVIGKKIKKNLKKNAPLKKSFF